MEKELKIVLVIFLTFFIYGITSLFSSGQFVTPIFLNQFVLLGVSVLFYGFNYRRLGSKLLLIYIPVVFFSLLMDGFSIAYLAKKLNYPELIEIRNSLFVGIAYLMIYFGFFLGFTIYVYSKLKNPLMLVFSCLLIVCTMALLFIPGYESLRDFVFFVYLILTVLFVGRRIEDLNKSIQVLSNQFLLLFLLEGLEYFQ